MRTRHLLGILLALVAVIATTGPTNAAATTERRVEIPPEGVLSAMTGGNTVGAIIREKKARADGYLHLDTPAMIKTLKAMHANTFTYGVWDGDQDWDDLRLEFAPAAQKAGIDIWVYLVPPSECFTNPAKHLNGNCSRPYDLDFVTWSTEIAKLSKKYPNIKAWAIDDFLSGPGNRALFTNEYLSQVRAAQDAINPKLGFYVTLYFGEIAPENLEIIDGVLDGVIYPYVGYNADTNDTDWVERRIDSALQTLEPYDLDLVFLQYTGRFLDTVIEPHEDTVAAILRRVQPYIEDGRVIGVIAYAAPVALDEQQASYTNRAHSGTGRLSFSINMFTGTSAGDYAEAKQEVRVDPRAAKKELTFSHRDPFGPWALKDYQFKQLLVDGQVVWESDISADTGYTWAKTTVDLTAALAGKQKATIAFRLFHKNGVGHWPTDVSIDDVKTRGLTVRNGDFENASAWQLSETNEGFRTFIDQYRADRQARIINEIGKVYADLRGQRHRTVEAPAWARAQWKKLHTGGDNVGVQRQRPALVLPARGHHVAGGGDLRQCVAGRPRAARSAEVRDLVLARRHVVVRRRAHPAQAARDRRRGAVEAVDPRRVGLVPDLRLGPPGRDRRDRLREGQEAGPVGVPDVQRQGVRRAAHGRHVRRHPYRRPRRPQPGLRDHVSVAPDLGGTADGADRAQPVGTTGAGASMTAGIVRSNGIPASAAASVT